MGDVIPTGRFRTDELGTYETVKLNPASAVAKFDKSLTDPAEVSTSGFSDKQLASGYDFIVKFVAAQGLDSVALDRDQRGWKAWKRDWAKRYIGSDALDLVLGFHNEQTDRPVVVLDDVKNTYPAMIRDRRPRLTKASITVDSVEAGKYQGRAYLRINGEATGTYRPTDKGMIQSILQLSPGHDRAEVKTQYPVLFDGRDGGGVLQEQKLRFSYPIVASGSSWQIEGINNFVETKNLGLG